MLYNVYTMCESEVVDMKENNKYTMPMQFTKAFRFCGNCFRVDMYRGCDFGCKYCSANKNCYIEKDELQERTVEDTIWKAADIKDIRKKFEQALGTDEDTKDVLVEVLRHRMPLHCGGMADPFQSREWKLHLTRQLIELCNEYQYPICFSTKTAYLPDDYFEILNPSLHAFQSSILGWDDEYVRKWERNTPTAKERLAFVKKLRDKGFWCSIRIQPIIEIEQAIKLIENAKNIPSYYTVEHLRLSNFMLELVEKEIKNTKVFKCNNHNLEAKKDIKIENIKRIIKIANGYNVKVGVGDNDLHYMSQSRCCCGIDLINEHFDNYMKYNLTYFATGEFNIDKIWTPEQNIRGYIQENTGVDEVYYREYTNNYIAQHRNWIGPNKTQVEKQLFGTVQRKLF